MTDRNRDLERPLIEKKRGGSSFGLNLDDLGELFKPDNIKDGISRKRLRDYGGVNGLLSKLKIEITQGVKSKSDREERVREFGDNSPIVRPQKSITELVTEQFEDKILQILCAASAISMIVGVIKEGMAKGWMEGLAILIAVIIIVSVTAGNNYIKDKQFRTLFAQSEIREVRVLRSGKVESVSVFDLVVGDLFYLETGELLPVDGVLVQSNNIEADESSVTGESDLIHKSVPVTFGDDEKANPFIISGSKIMEGTGLMLVGAVGENSQSGKMKSKLQEEEDETPLQLKLAVMADDIGKFGFMAAAITVSAMIIHLIVEIVINKNNPAAHHYDAMAILKHIVEFFILGVTIVVMAVPEGLPLAVVIALAFSVGKMKDENNLVRFLQACETMGGADNICSDKTGTLTKNLMTVTTIFVEETIHTKIEKNIISEGTRALLGESISINSNAFPKILKDGKFDHKGNKTECALLEHAYKLGYNFENYRPSDKIKRVITFSSKRKRMTTVWQANDNLARIYCKGAPDMILDKCTEYINKDGTRTKINEEFKTRILQKVVKPFARQSLRTILLAYKEINVGKNFTSFDSFSEDHLESDLIFIGIAGIKDPLRDEIPEAIKKCRSAGILVRMVTGDNRDTAVAISKDAGILPKDYEDNTESYEVMEGKDFRSYVGGLIEATKTEPSRVRDIQAFEVVAKNLKVLARSTPEDKYLLVTGLKQLNFVVAVTGDGTNDAPALKKADIGFAMGIAGTEVAKEAAGIILLDDNFSSIVTAVKWGRNIFDCIRKFLQFQLTINVVALTVAFIGGLSSRESPLNTIQMLWVNLIMDTFAALALATEPPNDELLKRKPYSRTESLLTPNMYRNIVTQAVFQLIILLGVLFFGPQIFSIPSSKNMETWEPERAVHYTMFFNIFVMLQLFNLINSRKLKKEEVNVFENFFNNSLFIGVLSLSFLIQIILVEIGGEAIRVVSLDFHHHIICIIIGSLSLVCCYISKQIPDEIFNNFKLFRDEVKEEEMMKQPTFVEKMRRESRQRKSMRQRSMGSFHKI